MDKFDHFFMRVAEEAALLSYSQRLKVGCVATRNRRILATGYNGTPTGYENHIDEQPGDKRYVHAEENVIAQLALSTESSRDATLYVTHLCCPNCAKLIAQCGFVKVIYKYSYRDESGLDMLQTLGVEVVRYN